MKNADVIVCIVCYKKGTRSLSKSEIEVVKQHILEGFKPENSDSPIGICTNCSVLLSKRELNHEMALPLPNNYDPNRPKNLRSSTDKCDCRICTVARADFNESRKLKGKRGRPKSSADNNNTNSNNKICATCFAKIKRL